MMQRFLGVLVASICAIGLLPGSLILAQSRSQNAMPQTDWAFRFDLFQMLIEQNGLKPLGSYREALQNPGQTVLVALGDCRATTTMLKSFFSRGGAVLVATDTHLQLDRFFRLAAGPIESGLRANRFQNFADCIVIAPERNSHPLMSNVEQLVINRAGTIAGLTPSDAWQVVARLPAELGDWAGRGGQPIMATIEGASAGRFVLASDHSLFINGMMWHGSNAIFAVNTSRWLSENRKQVLFIVNDSIQESYLLGPLKDQLPLPQLDSLNQTPELTLEQKVRLANAAVKQVEESGVVNDMLANVARNLPQRSYFRLLLQCLAGVLVAYGLYKLVRHARGPTVLVAPLRRQSALEIGRQAIDAGSRQIDSLRLLARNFCMDLTTSSNPQVWRSQLSNPNRVLDDNQRRQLALVLDLAEDRVVGKLTESLVLDIGRSLVELRHLLSHDFVSSERRRL